MGSRLDSLQELLAADPTSPAFVELARELLAAGHAERAAGVAAAGIVHHPDHVEARLVAGRAHLRLGQGAEARAHFEALLARHPGDVGIHVAVAEALLERGLRRAAGQLVRKALALRPGDPALLALLGRVEAETGPAAAPADPQPSPAAGAGSVGHPAGTGSLPPPAGLAQVGASPASTGPATSPAPGAQPASTGPATSPAPDAQPASTGPATSPAPGAQPASTGTATSPAPGAQPTSTGTATSAASGTQPGSTGTAKAPGAATAPPAAERTPVVDLPVPPPLHGSRPQAAPPPPLPPVAGQGAAPGGTAGDLLADLPLPPAPPAQEAAPVDGAAVAAEAASVAAAYERELRERLAAEQVRPPSWLRRHRFALLLGALLCVGGGAAWGAYGYLRAATHEEDVARYTAAARNGLLRDTRSAYRASLTALAEVLGREPENPSARALKALALAQLATRFGEGDPAAARKLLGPAEEAAEPEAVLAARWLLAAPGERDDVAEAILGRDPAAAGATVHSLAGAIHLERGEQERAIQRFNAAIAAVPGHVPTLVRVADHYRSRHEHSEALRYDRLALAVVEDHPEALLGAAESQLVLAREPAGLEEALAGLSQVPPENFPAADRDRRILVRARLLAGLGRREAARAELEPLLARAADDEALLPGVALALVQAGVPDRALELFRQERLGPGSPLPVREAWARALLARGRYRAVTTIPAAEGDRSLHLLKGRAWLLLGERGRARVELRKTATRQAGKMPADAVVYLAIADLEDGQLQKARKNLERLGTGPRARTAGRWGWARLLIREGRLQEAEEVLREAVAADRDAVEARAELGRLLVRRGDQAGASWLQEALERNPHHVGARVALAELHLAAQPEAARSHLEAALAERADAPEVLATFALLELREGRRQEAERRLAQAARLAPSAPGVALARAELARLDRDPKGVLAQLERAVRADGTDPRTWLLLGEARLAQGAAAPARQAFARAAALDPAAVAAEVGIARAMLLQKQAPQAEQRLNARLAKDESLPPPARAVLLATLAEVLQGRKQEEAMRRAEEAVAAAAEVAAGHLVLGALHAEARAWEAAERHLRLAAELAPADPATAHRLGQFLLDRGNREEGERLLARYIASAPEGPARTAARKRLDQQAGPSR